MIHSRDTVGHENFVPMIQQSQHLISNRLATNDRDSLGICGTQLLISQSVRVEPPEK